MRSWVSFNSIHYFSSVSLQKTWLLNDVYVKETQRKHGIGRMLLDEAKLFGKESGAGWLLLQTANDNYIAQIVYEKKWLGANGRHVLSIAHCRAAG